MPVFRIYVEKKPAFAAEAAALLAEIKEILHIGQLASVRILNRYDVEGIDEAVFSACRDTVFSEPPVDRTFSALPEDADFVFAVEPLPGQFDQRADSCAQCIQIVSQGERPAVRTAAVYLFSGCLTEADLDAVKSHLINPVESRQAALEQPETLEMPYDIPADVPILSGFTALSKEALSAVREQYGLAMDLSDLAFLQAYFLREKRNPTETELRVIDTYWSDHCRHTTFLTTLDTLTCEDKYVKRSLDRYREIRKSLGRDKKPVTLMDLATIGAKYLKSKGLLKQLDESEEINACTVRIKVDENGKDADWLLLFKNETHNHPTEIEPFGGAATCIGGAIRDPLSGRGYVYQAMRVTGSGDPLTPAKQTLPGKLSQRTITTTAARGYSSYGNQIGLATGLVSEIYHPGYVAKRMEIGAVLGAAPAKNVVRKAPVPGDVIILVGGRTGRDGCGGATGSSKAHSADSLAACGAEVQKGNAPEERKLQRLFRDPAVTRMIKRCNDFGAGGVSVAIGELARGLHINLNAVPKKYNGLTGTELAISESQERMAVVVDKADAPLFIRAASRENLEATIVAAVTESPRMVMEWNGKKIVDLSREFLSSNGAEKHAAAHIPPMKRALRAVREGSLRHRLETLVSNLNVCSARGLTEQFDSTIGAGTVLMPMGGTYQATPIQAMACKLPVLSGDTKTCSLMAYGFDPFMSEENPWRGAYLSVVESVAKVIAAGGTLSQCWLTFQEYFERLSDDPVRWGKPAAALLGALSAQLDLGVGAIGGKDSMSGSFGELNVPPTLVSFAVSVSDVDLVISPEFKSEGSPVYFLAPKTLATGLPDPEDLSSVLYTVEQLVHQKKVLSAYVTGENGLAEALFKMCLGNRMGVRLDASVRQTRLFAPARVGFVLELAEPMDDAGKPIGTVTNDFCLTTPGESIDLFTLQKLYDSKLEPVFPSRAGNGDEPVPLVTQSPGRRAMVSSMSFAAPRALVPVFPGTNCEYDTARSLIRAGALPEIWVIRNLTATDISESIEEMAKAIARSQMIILPGGFSGGDEPDGSGKFITAFFRNPRIENEVMNLLYKRDGLMCGICNGFQALIKLGLVPYGQIIAPSPDSPTLTHNAIGRHQSMLVHTRVSANRSPWLSKTRVGDIHLIAMSHGEGRFVASEQQIKKLIEGDQIATQYVDLSGNPTMDIRYNPNGAACAVEAITSPDGRVLGKMGHTERSGNGLYKNVGGNKFQPLFEGAVDYYKI